MRVVRILLTTIAPHALFWSWNLLIAAVVTTILPELAADLVKEAWQGALPWDLAGVGLGLLAAPFLAMAAWVPVRREPGKVARLLFGVEAPLLLAGFVRLTLLREVTPAVAYLLLVVGLAGFALLLDLYRRRTSPLTLPELAGHAVLLVVAGWVGATLSFYAPPTVWLTLELGADWIADFFRWVRSPRDAFFGMISIGMVLGTLGMFAVLPVGFFASYLTTFRRLFRETAGKAGTGAAAVATAIGVTLTLTPVVVLDRHPQVEAFARLEAPPADDTARAALLADEALLREGLLNAYLAKYRYWTSTGEANHVGAMYKEMGIDGLPDATQDLYNQLTRPFVYQGESLDGDRDRAAALYADFFDEPLQKREQDAVLHAMNATWDRSTVEAGLLDVNGEKVRLARQEITVTVAGGLATVRLDETYRNLTLDQQEIFYYFSLPESAAVTGLWLSDDPADPERYPGVLAPRGAAQQVYLEQRVERRDPALLEQVGPRQYRLRAFPILPRARAEAEGPPLSVRVTYSTLVGPEGVPLPSLHERRNVFWDERTERVGPELADVGDAWLPARIAAKATPAAHAAEVGSGYVVTATPYDTAAPAPVGGRYAVVVDRSYSMGAHAAEVGETLAWLEREVAPQNDVDVYVTAGWGAGEPVRHEDVPAAGTLLWFGRLEPHEMMFQYNALRAGRTYDAVLLLTDAGAYDLALRDPPPVPDPGGPLWMVHLGGAFAPAYDDAFLQAIQGSRGGVAGAAREVFARRAAADACEGGEVVDGHLWCVGAGTVEAPAAPAFAALAARQFVLHQARAADMAVVANLDAVHRVAKAANVVTPYSSLIALVDDAQRRRLAELEAKEDRFTREAESGVEGLTAPMDPFAVTAVPEPEEWAMLIVACGIALASWWQKRRVLA